MSEVKQQQTVCYWPDGYWITDPEEAALLDSVDAFGAEHQTMEIPGDDDIQSAVNNKLELIPEEAA